MAIGNIDGKAYHLTTHRGRFGVIEDFFHQTHLPQCDDEMRSSRLYVGGDFWIHVAPGFEYCLDAPDYSPAGGHSAMPIPYNFD